MGSMHEFWTAIAARAGGSWFSEAPRVPPTKGKTDGKLVGGDRMTLNLRPDIEATLHARAQAQGLSVEDYIASLIADNSTPSSRDNDSSVDAEAPKSGMVMENGLLIYRTGRPLPPRVVENAILRSREERMAHI